MNVYTAYLISNMAETQITDVSKYCFIYSRLWILTMKKRVLLAKLLKISTNNLSKKCNIILIFILDKKTPYALA